MSSSAKVKLCEVEKEGNVGRNEQQRVKCASVNKYISFISHNVMWRENKCKTKLDGADNTRGRGANGTK